MSDTGWLSLPRRFIVVVCDKKPRGGLCSKTAMRSAELSTTCLGADRLRELRQLVGAIGEDRVSSIHPIHVCCNALGISNERERVTPRIKTSHIVGVTRKIVDFVRGI